MKGGGDQELNLPAGFRFHPTDEELVEHYLCRKCSGQFISVPNIIPEIDLYKFDPWQLPGMSRYGEKEWYFFSPRDRKYPNGSRPNRAAGTGYWKATGADKPVGKPKTLGIKKALVFYAGKAPKGVKSNWIMHEYRLANVDRSAGKRVNMKLDDWVLCRIYNKKGRLEKYYNMDHRNHHHKAAEAEDFLSDSEEQKPNVDLLSRYVDNPRPLVQDEYTMRMMVESNNASVKTMPELKTESNSTDQHVFSVEFNKEVESEPTWSELETCTVDFQMNYMEGFHDVEPFGFDYNEHLSVFPDMIEYVQKPF